jgi:hypothetical protein
MNYQKNPDLKSGNCGVLFLRSVLYRLLDEIHQDTFRRCYLDFEIVEDGNRTQD